MSNFEVTNERERKLYRLFEILPGMLSWLTLIASLVFSFIFPIHVAVFIIIFDVYWLIRVVYLSFFLIRSYFALQRNMKIDWKEKSRKLEGEKDLYHLVIIPTYKEGIEVLRPTFSALSKARYDLKRMMVVFAVEEGDKENGLKNAEIIKKEFAEQFDHFMVTIHPKGLPGEVAGKGSNAAWAAGKAKEVIDSKKLEYENVVVTTLDSDTCVYKDYFGCLAYHYLTSEDRTRASYQPIPMFFNNIWDSPALMRVIAMSHTYWMLMEQSRPERLYTFSSHSMSFKALVDVGFWQTDVVSEDSRIFWQCFMQYNGDYRVHPMFIPVYMDTVLASTFKQSIINQYKQQRRWAWGAENIPYIFLNFVKNRAIPLRKKLFHGFLVIEGFHGWATNALMIFILGWLPLFAGGEAFRSTVLAQNLPYVTQWLMTISMVGMFVSAGLTLFILPKRPRAYGRGRFAMMFLQWVLLPITTIFLGSFPALDSQTRLMIGKRMGFWVTEKVRKEQ